MRSKALRVVALIIVGVILQLAIAPNIAIFGISPNFLLLIIVLAALIDGPTTGTIVGFILGLIFDLISTGPVGPMALVGTLVGFLIGSLQSNISANGWVMALTVYAIGSFMADFSYALILEILNSDFAFWSSVLFKVIPSTLYNTAIALAVFPLLNKIFRPSANYMTVKKRY